VQAAKLLGAAELGLSEDLPPLDSRVVQAVTLVFNRFSNDVHLDDGVTALLIKILLNNILGKISDVLEDPVSECHYRSIDKLLALEGASPPPLQPPLCDQIGDALQCMDNSAKVQKLRTWPEIVGR